MFMKKHVMTCFKIQISLMIVLCFTAATFQSDQANRCTAVSQQQPAISCASAQVGFWTSLWVFSPALLLGFL